MSILLVEQNAKVALETRALWHTWLEIGRIVNERHPANRLMHIPHQDIQGVLSRRQRKPVRAANGAGKEEDVGVKWDLCFGQKTGNQGRHERSEVRRERAWPDGQC